MILISKKLIDGKIIKLMFFHYVFKGVKIRALTIGFESRVMSRCLMGLIYDYLVDLRCNISDKIV